LRLGRLGCRCRRGWWWRRWRRWRRRHDDEREHVRYLRQIVADVQDRDRQQHTEHNDVRRGRNEHGNAAPGRRPMTVSTEKLEHRSPPHLSTQGSIREAAVAA